jgi:hypothetical protein
MGAVRPLEEMAAKEVERLRLLPDSPLTGAQFRPHKYCLTSAISLG